MKRIIYLIGSLRNPRVPKLASRLRAHGHEVFDDWHAAGPRADDEWMKYERERQHNLKQALNGFSARHTFSYDLYHLLRATMGVMLMPAGKSGHLEFGFLIGQGKKGYILYDKEPKRWDVMHRFATGVYFDVEELVKVL